MVAAPMHIALLVSYTTVQQRTLGSHAYQVFTFMCVTFCSAHYSNTGAGVDISEVAKMLAEQESGAAGELRLPQKALLYFPKAGTVVALMAHLHTRSHCRSSAPKLWLLQDLLFSCSSAASLTVTHFHALACYRIID